MPISSADRRGCFLAPIACMSGNIPAKAVARHFCRRALLAVLCSYGTLALLTGLAHGQDTPDYFTQNCKNCHTIGGGRLTGPDLKDVGKRQSKEWLVKFLMNPKAVIDSGDPYAKKIFEESRSIMPTPPGITPERAEKLLELIEKESALEESQFKGVQVSTAPFTDVDRARGRGIFLGPQRLESGGTACVSCHGMHDAPALGGGQLGPDLTNVYERLRGRAALSAWLMAPGTETMQPIFKNHPLAAGEIHALVAYFESSTAERPADPSTGRVTFLLSGLAGAVFGVFFLDAIWKRRFHSVRRSLVEANTSRGKS
ncbi:MAG: c-type cytochrome [Planctomycetes bacterium]|nr:c-type cytochrome [Planctomycetota bacterium]